jgi:hypothetical protein
MYLGVVFISPMLLKYRRGGTDLALLEARLELLDRSLHMVMLLSVRPIILPAYRARERRHTVLGIVMIPVAILVIYRLVRS